LKEKRLTNGVEAMGRKEKCGRGGEGNIDLKVAVKVKGKNAVVDRIAEYFDAKRLDFSKTSVVLVCC